MASLPVRQAGSRLRALALVADSSAAANATVVGGGLAGATPPVWLLGGKP